MLPRGVAEREAGDREPYGPDARFTVGGAMGRNGLIYCMADLAVVASAAEGEGGTWAAATETPGGSRAALPSVARDAKGVDDVIRWRYDGIMIRLQVRLEEEQLDALRRMAAAADRSLSDLVREGVDTLVRTRGGVSRESVKRRSLAAVGRFHSGISDLARGHDRHLAEAFDE